MGEEGDTTLDDAGIGAHTSLTSPRQGKDMKKLPLVLTLSLALTAGLAFAPRLALAGGHHHRGFHGHRGGHGGAVVVGPGFASPFVGHPFFPHPFFPRPFFGPVFVRPFVPFGVVASSLRHHPSFMPRRR